jgi:hypothetical protein
MFVDDQVGKYFPVLITSGVPLFTARQSNIVLSPACHLWRLYGISNLFYPISSDRCIFSKLVGENRLSDPFQGSIDSATTMEKAINAGRYLT